MSDRTKPDLSRFRDAEHDVTEGDRMTTDLSPRARCELDALAQIRGPRRAEAILIAHQRRDIGSCLCGWSELGKSHAGHQVAELRRAGLLVSKDESDSTP